MGSIDPNGGVRPFNSFLSHKWVAKRRGSKQPLLTFVVQKDELTYLIPKTVVDEEKTRDEL